MYNVQEEREKALGEAKEKERERERTETEVRKESITIEKLEGELEELTDEQKAMRRLSLGEEELFSTEQDIEEERKKAKEADLKEMLQGSAIAKAKDNVRQSEDRVKLRYISFFLLSTVSLIFSSYLNNF